MYSQLNTSHVKQLNTFSVWLLAENINKPRKDTSSSSSISGPPGLEVRARNPNEGPQSRNEKRAKAKKIKQAAEASNAAAGTAATVVAEEEDPVVEALVATDLWMPEIGEAALEVHVREVHAEVTDFDGRFEVRRECVQTKLDESPQTPEQGRRDRITGRVPFGVKNTFLDFDEAKPPSVSARSSPAREVTSEEPQSPEQLKEEVSEWRVKMVDMTIEILKTTSCASLTHNLSVVLGDHLSHSKTQGDSSDIYKSLVEKSNSVMLTALRARPHHAPDLLKALLRISGKEFLQLWLENVDDSNYPETMQLKDANDKELIPAIAEVWARFWLDAETETVDQSSCRTELTEATCSLIALASEKATAVTASYVLKEVLPVLPSLGRSKGKRADLSRWLVSKLQGFWKHSDFEATAACLRALAAGSVQRGVLCGIVVDRDDVDVSAELSHVKSLNAEMAKLLDSTPMNSTLMLRRVRSRSWCTRCRLTRRCIICLAVAKA